jgi:PIN domain nuclease of toxin-antitoxin system
VILLDTHVVIWLALTPEKISPAAATAIRETELAGAISGISVMTIYEVANAIRLGRIKPAVPHQVFLDRIRSRFKVFPVSDTIAQCAAELPAPFHGDPMDRIITATAIVEGCTLITKDEKIRDANLCKVIW